MSSKKIDRISVYILGGFLAAYGLLYGIVLLLKAWLG